MTRQVPRMICSNFTKVIVSYQNYVIFCCWQNDYLMALNNKLAGRCLQTESDCVPRPISI